MIIKGYELVNQQKLDRVILGKQGGDGALHGGLGLYDDEGNAVDENGKPVDGDKIIAMYDREGGLIRKDGIKIRIGAFWDFRFKKPREKPDIMYVFPIGAGDFVEVRDPSELGSAMQTIEQAKQKRSKTFKEKKSKSKFKDVK